MTEATLFLPGLSPVGGKEITATFDGGQLSSDGGVLILREIEKQLGIAAMLSACVPDVRDQSRVGLDVASQQVILGQPGHRRVAFDAEVRPMIVVQRGSRTPTGRLGEKFCIAFIRGLGAKPASMR